MLLHDIFGDSIPCLPRKTFSLLKYVFSDAVSDVCENLPVCVQGYLLHIYGDLFGSTKRFRTNKL